MKKFSFILFLFLIQMVVKFSSLVIPPDKTIGIYQLSKTESPFIENLLRDSTLRPIIYENIQQNHYIGFIDVIFIEAEVPETFVSDKWFLCQIFL